MRITRHLLLAIVLAIVTHTALYAQKYTAASQISSSGTYTIVESEFDNSGNLIYAGNFTGSITIGGKTITSAGSQDIFIACFNTSMFCYQLLQFGGTSAESVSALTTDASSNIYFAGPGTSGVKIGSYTFTANGAFVAKLNSGGSVQFVTPYLNNGSNVSSTTSCGSSPGCSISATNSYTYINFADIVDISVDAVGNIYFSGTYKGSLTETGTGAYTTTSPQAVCNGPSPCGTRYKNYTAFYYGYNTAFAGKISGSGIKVWTQKYGGGLSENTRGNTITASNKAVYFTYYDEKVANTPQVMITRLTTGGGNTQWTRNYISTSVNEGGIDSRSNFYFYRLLQRPYRWFLYI